MAGGLADFVKEVARTFRERLRRLRLAHNLTQEDLARRAGVAVSTVCHLEQGRHRKPGRRTLEGLAKALGAELADGMLGWG